MNIRGKVDEGKGEREWGEVRIEKISVAVNQCDAECDSFEGIRGNVLQRTTRKLTKQHTNKNAR